jgi:hypothetical protein
LGSSAGGSDEFGFREFHGVKAGPLIGNFCEPLASF